MYAKLEALRDFLNESVCKNVKLKRVELDEHKNEIYKRVHPQIYIFDEITTYNTSKMPYIKLYATELSTIDSVILSITLEIFIKNDGIYSKNYDEEGNELAEPNFEPNDEEAWKDAIVLAQNIQRALLNSDVERNFLLDDSQSIEIIPVQADYVGNGLAQVDVKFDLKYPPYPRVLDEFLL